MPELRVVARDEGEMVSVGIEDQKAEGEFLFHRVGAERAVEAVEHLEGMLIFFSVLKVVFDRHPEHAAQNRAVEKRFDSRLGRFGEDDCEAIFRQPEEIEVKTAERDPIEDGDADI